MSRVDDMNGDLLTLAEANQLVRLTKFTEAREAYRIIIESEQENSAAWYGLGVVSNYLKDSQSAIDSFEKSFELNQYHAPTAANLAILYSKNDPEGASKFAIIALNLGLENKQLSELIITPPLVQQELPLVAAEIIEEVDASVEPDVATKAISLIEENQYEEALELLSPLLENEHQNSAELWTLCSLCLLRLGFVSDAMNSVNYSLTIQPEDKDAMNLLREIESQLETDSMEDETGDEMMEDEAELTPEAQIQYNDDAEVDDLIEEDSDEIALEDSYVVLVSNARQHSELGQHAAAVQLWKKILEEYGSTSEAWHGMAEALEAAGHIEKGKQCRKKAEELQNSSTTTSDNSNSEVDLVAAAKDAKERLSRDVGIENDNVNVSIEWYNKGLILLGENKNLESLNCFEKAITTAPRTEVELRVRSYNGCGHALHQLGRFAESIQSYHQAISLSPQLVTGKTLYNMGSSYAALEHFQDATRCFEQALERNLDSEEEELCKNQINRCNLLLKEIIRNERGS